MDRGKSGRLRRRPGRKALQEALEANRSEVTNVTAYQGLELRMRGTPGSYIVQIGTEAVTDFDYYNAYVEVTPDWALFRIPFEDFQQEGFGQPQRWTGSETRRSAARRSCWTTTS